VYHLLKRYGIICLLVCVLNAQATAQQLQRPSHLPEGTDASTEEEYLLKKKPFEEFRKKPKVDIEREHELKEAPLSEADKNFFIKDVIVEGNVIVKSSEIDPLVKEYEGKEVSLRQLIELADRITAIYAARGYVTSQAYVPPQRIENETVTIQVIEGQYGDFDIETGIFTRRSIIENRLKKRPGERFNYNDLRKDLMYLNGNPDRMVKAVMVRGQEPRTTDFKVIVKDGQPVHIGYEFANTGNKYTGNWLHTYKGTSTGFLLYDDMLTGRFIRSENGRLWGAAISYLLPVNEFGTKISFSASHFQTWATHGLKEFDIKSYSTTYSSSFQQPVFDFGWVSATGDVGMDIKESLSETLAMPYSMTKLRILKVGLTMEESDQWGRSVIRNEVNVSNNNWLSSRVLFPNNNQIQPKYPDASFVKWAFRASRVNVLPFKATLLLNVEGQMTDYSVPSSEQHRIGGAYTVRGHNEAAALGDNGINVTSEIRFPMYFIPDDFYICNVSPKQVVQGVVFLDAGVVQVHQPFNDATKKLTRLIGTGMGLRVNLLNAVSIRFDVGWPLGIRSTHRKPRIHLYASYEDPTYQERQRMLEQIMQNKMISSMKKAMNEVPQDVIDKFEKAQKLESEGKLEEAKELYSEVVQRKNEFVTDARAKIELKISTEDEIKALYDEAERYYDEGNFEQAKGLYQKLLSLQGEKEGKG